MENVKSKKEYENIYYKKWNECLKLSKKNSENTTEDMIYSEATKIFNDIANSDEIVGYYIVLHDDSALNDWKDNIIGKTMTKQDKRINEILEILYVK